MIEYYAHYIDPASPARSKLAIHLNAQTQAATESSTVTAVVEKGKKVLGLDKPEGESEVVEKPIGNGTTPFVITDVRAFKSKLQVSSGPQPVKHISEFEELDSKL